MSDQQDRVEMQSVVETAQKIMATGRDKETLMLAGCVLILAKSNKQLARKVSKMVEDAKVSRLRGFESK